MLRNVELANAHREVDRVEILQCRRKRCEVCQQVQQEDCARKGEGDARERYRARACIVQSRNDVDQTVRSRSPSFKLPSR